VRVVFLDGTKETFYGPDAEALRNYVASLITQSSMSKPQP